MRRRVWRAPSGPLRARKPSTPGHPPLRSGCVAGLDQVVGYYGILRTRNGQAAAAPSALRPRRARNSAVTMRSLWGDLVTCASDSSALVFGPAPDQSGIRRRRRGSELRSGLLQAPKTSGAGHPSLRLGGVVGPIELLAQLRGSMARVAFESSPRLQPSPERRRLRRAVSWSPLGPN